MANGKRGLPPLDWLKVFEAAGRLGGFSAAAREFGLTQAAVSQRIGNLEAWLGRPLFLRRARGVTLTMDGESYLPLVQESLQALERSTEDLFGKTPREFRVAGMASHINRLLLPHLGPFLAQFPSTRILAEALSHRSDFDDEPTWLQIRFGRGSWPGRIARLVRREVLVPMAAPATGTDAQVIEVRGTRPGWQAWAAATGRQPPTPGQISVDSMEHGLMAACLGQGIVLGSCALARPELEDGRLRRLDLPEIATEDGYWLTWPEDRLSARREGRLVDALHAALIA